MSFKPIPDPRRDVGVNSLNTTEHAKRDIAFGRRLRAWYRAYGRDLPWRRTRDPYRILISELMLQQTQVSRVLDYYDRFLERFPSLSALARARPGQVREAWEGLGYYARARNLHRLAREVTDRGGAPNETLPADPRMLRELPGIGEYTAGAVASFAYERRAELVDTNVARVLRRAFAPHADFKTAAGKRELWQIARRLLPRTGRATWTHNQALMELGALICTARVARCDQCPVRTNCRTAQARDVSVQAHQRASPDRLRGQSR
jgi:A/G-specific adenine glycosylase